MQAEKTVITRDPIGMGFERYEWEVGMSHIWNTYIKEGKDPSEFVPVSEFVKGYLFDRKSSYSGHPLDVGFLEKKNGLFRITDPGRKKIIAFIQEKLEAGRTV